MPRAPRRAAATAAGIIHGRRRGGRVLCAFGSVSGEEPRERIARRRAPSDEQWHGERRERDRVGGDLGSEPALATCPRERRQHGNPDRGRGQDDDDEDAVRGEEPVGLGPAAELPRDDDTDGGREAGLDGERESGDAPLPSERVRGRRYACHRREAYARMRTDTAWTDTALDELRSEFGDAYGGRTVLVTGADGFMGSHLTDALVELGANVHAFVRATSSGALNNIGHLRNRLKVHFADLTDKTSIDYLIRELKEARPTSRTSSISAPRRTSASRGTGRTRP